MDFRGYILAAIGWALFGSFALVLFQRLGQDASRSTIKSILMGRSVCDHTGKPLAWHELIPIWSYLKQQGKSSTWKKLSSLYLWSELCIALVFVLTLAWGNNLGLPVYEIIFWMITNTLMIGLVVYDIQKLELHLPLWAIVTVWVLIWQFGGVIGSYSIAFWGSIVMMGLFFWLYYGSQYYLKRRHGTKQEWLGEWDIYVWFLVWTLAPFVFIYQGIFPSVAQSIGLVLYFMILSSVIGLMIAFLLRYYGYKSKQVPFIPAMILAYYILMRSGQYFIS